VKFPVFRPSPPFSIPYYWIGLNCGRCLFFWEWGKSEVWLDDAEVGEQLLSLLILDRRVDDHIVARNPVDRGSDLVLVPRLKRIQCPKYLCSIATSRGWVGKNEADSLLRVNDENRADGEGNALRVNVGCILVIQPR
jgi:hypothetical protein